MNRRDFIQILTVGTVIGGNLHGKTASPADFLTVINLNQSVPANHPLRAIKRHVDIVLQNLSPLTV